LETAFGERIGLTDEEWAVIGPLMPSKRVLNQCGFRMPIGTASRWNQATKPTSFAI